MHVYNYEDELMMTESSFLSEPPLHWKSWQSLLNIIDFSTEKSSLDILLNLKGHKCE